MVPLAVSGRIVIAAAFVFAVVLLRLLLRMNARDEAANMAQEEAANKRENDTHAPNP
jgi:hypothetical protein